MADNGEKPFTPEKKQTETVTPGLETLAIPIPLTAGAGFLTENGHAVIDCRSFSQLLAGAMASPAAGNSRSAPVLALPVDGVRLPIVAVPCIIAPASLLESSGFAGQFAMTHQAVLATVTAQAQMQLQAAYSSPSVISTATPVPLQQVLPPAPEENSVSATIASPADQKLQNNVSVSKTPSTDPFNWRKYGQKQVKSGENTRSYYKCTYANCSAKKKVERCRGGHVVEIIYRGDHNHDPPLKSKSQKEKGPVGNLSEEIESVKLAIMDANGSADHALKMTPRRPTDRNSSQKIKELKIGTPTCDLSYGDGDMKDSVASSSKAMEDSSDRQLVLVVDRESDASIKTEEGHASEPPPKRRIKESSFSSSAPSPKIVKEQRVVVQRMSNGGAANDGYRWRKYGQKFVKGNPNPRSYYRCTHIGCPVRKHVEKDAADPMALIIAYDGDHNHNCPPPKHDSDTPVLLIAAAAAVADTTPDPSSKLEPQPDVENGGDQTLESAQTLLSMGLSPADDGESAATESDNLQRPMFDENVSAVRVHDA